jgi:NCAIR mutase (PurE)-related protein
MYASMRKALSGVQYQARARVAVVKPKPEAGAGAVPLPAKQRRLPGMVCVVSAGPADQAAADAVKLMAEHLGCFVTAKGGLSTGDLPALLEQLPALQAADVVIAVAGADSGLPGVVAGMVDAPVVALPTAAGDAGGLGGLGSLVSAVASAAAGVSVVGIDQAGAAASTAARILRTAAARVEKLTAAAAAAASAVPAGAAASAGLAANNVVPHSALDGCLTLTPAVPVAAAAPAH